MTPSPDPPDSPNTTPWRLGIVAATLALAYALALWQPVRSWYSDMDKLAHGVAFAGVYLALTWALRWPALPLALLCLALGAGVEVHQMFLPGFSPSVADWLADAAGIALAAVVREVVAGGHATPANPPLAPPVTGAGRDLP